MLYALRLTLTGESSKEYSLPALSAPLPAYVVRWVLKNYHLAICLIPLFDLRECRRENEPGHQLLSGTVAYPVFLITWLQTREIRQISPDSLAFYHNLQ